MAGVCRLQDGLVNCRDAWGELGKGEAEFGATLGGGGGAPRQPAKRVMAIAVPRNPAKSILLRKGHASRHSHTSWRNRLVLPRPGICHKLHWSKCICALLRAAAPGGHPAVQQGHPAGALGHSAVHQQVIHPATPSTHSPIARLLLMWFFLSFIVVSEGACRIASCHRRDLRKRPCKHVAARKAGPRLQGWRCPCAALCLLQELYHRAEHAVAVQGAGADPPR
jgi:hypothetical protein